MEISFLSILTLGFLLGIKHAIEPDHIIAVSTIASESKKLSRSSLAGVFWGIGHTSTLLAVGIIVIVLNGAIPEILSMSLEFTVGIMLIYLGVNRIYNFKKKINSQSENHHRHHQNQSKKFPYFKSMIIGLVHGLAGSAAMVLLTMSTAQDVGEAVFYIFIFGIGTIVGMLFFTTIIGVPFVLSVNHLSAHNALTLFTGVISTVFGVYYMYKLAFIEGLFKLWLQAL
ncbi:HoxN/HupN/NixA family nickel/cobalt transporter [Bacillus sp. T33-2]|uniref:HoxN/HupN/NixA family nickel/cobalt transporter n=1 Tax=Bacillus sp. T33-2 TaxID=2054168 RepID=UPI000C78B272|nr:sulfite exporter TauE/SafE family protein [Bacillus sp. T33-2]PLR94668.1 urease accessory protein UreH [Bacillus sp. T33-2]